MFELEALCQISPVSTRPTTQEGKRFYCSKALVICGSNAISKNDEKKRAKAALMTLNLIGIPCQVWPWKDISHSTSDCGRGEGLCVCLQLLCNCKFLFKYTNMLPCVLSHIIVAKWFSLNLKAISGLQVQRELFYRVCLRNGVAVVMRLWGCLERDYPYACEQPETRPLGCRDLWSSDVCATLSVQYRHLNF